VTQPAHLAKRKTDEEVAAMSEKKNDCCGGAVTLIFPCSGASDVGELSDRAGRKLTKDGAGKMFCLAGIGGKVENIVNATRNADLLLAIDGCPQDCAKKTLEQAGFQNFRHARVTDFGMKKGLTEVNEDSIEKVVFRCKEIL
jgi:uncharacterized metal-binding protein